MQTERCYPDLRKQMIGLSFQPGITLDGEAEVQTTNQEHVDPAIAVKAFPETVVIDWIS